MHLGSMVGDGSAYHPDFGKPVPYKFESMPDDPDAQVKITVRRLIENALREYQSPIIEQCAAEALANGGGDPIQGVWAAVKPYIRFRQDYDIAQDLQVDDPRKRSIVETIIPPVAQAWLIKMRGAGVGDCDCFTGYAIALLLALGVPTYMCTVSAEGERPWEFSHIYIVAYPNGQRVPMDISHGPYPGWECPNLGRKREWPVSAEALRPSLVSVIALAAAAGGFLLWRRAA
jgi:hypothetical protein